MVKKEIVFMILIITLINLFPLISAETFGYGRTEDVPINYSTIPTVNNSEYFDGYSVASLWTYYSGLGNSIWCKLTGCTMSGDIDMDGNKVLNSLIVESAIFADDTGGNLFSLNDATDEITYFKNINSSDYNIMAGNVKSDYVSAVILQAVSNSEPLGNLGAEGITISSTGAISTIFSKWNPLLFNTSRDVDVFLFNINGSEPLVIKKDELDLGTNSISDGNFTGDWNFLEGNYVNMSSGVGSNGDMILKLESDKDNSVENSQPKLLFSYDGGNTSWIGFDGGSNDFSISNDQSGESHRITMETAGTEKFSLSNDGDFDFKDGNLTTTGNITADYFKGDGSELTGISAGFENPATEDLNMSGYEINLPFNSTHISGINVGDAIGSSAGNLLRMITDQSKVNISDDIIYIQSDMNGMVVAPFKFVLTKVGGNGAIATYAQLNSEDNAGLLEGRRLIFRGANSMTSGAVDFIADNLMVNQPSAGTGGTINYWGLKYDFTDFTNGGGQDTNKRGIYLERGNYLNFAGAGVLSGIGIDLVGWGDDSLVGLGTVSDKISYRQDGGNVIYDHDIDKGYTKYGDNQEIIMGASGDNFIMNFTTDGWLEIYNSTGLGKVRALEYATSTPKDLNYSADYLDLLPENPLDLHDTETGKIKPEYLGNAYAVWYEENPNDCWEVEEGTHWCKTIEIPNGETYENCERERPIDWEKMEIAQERKIELEEPIYKEGFIEKIKYGKKCNKTIPVGVTLLAEQSFNLYNMMAERQAGMKINLSSNITAKTNTLLSERYLTNSPHDKLSKEDKETEKENLKNIKKEDNLLDNTGKLKKSSIPTIAKPNEEEATFDVAGMSHYNFDLNLEQDLQIEELKGIIIELQKKIDKLEKKQK